MRLIKNISFFIVIAIIITLLSNYLASVFLFVYLKQNIIGLLLTLLAINTATLGLIASKIQDFVVIYPKINFEKTLQEMRFSLKEQIALITLSIVTLIVLESTKIIYIYKETICNVILVSILIYAIDILWDTGKAVFVVIDEIQKFKKNIQ